jgi:4-amino-4-deoxy-L-arabinose transferase-like glycosyltransferase
VTQTAGPGPLARNRRLRWLLLALVLAISAWIQFTVASRTVTQAPLRADAAHYFSYAYNLRHYGIYSGALSWDARQQVPVPDSIATPGYPLFLLAVPGLAPEQAWLDRVSRVQAALGVLSVWLVYLVGARLLGPGAALAGALLAATSPHLATISTYLLTESLFLFLLLASVLATLAALQAGGRWRYALAGLAWGLCSLVRPTMQFLPALFLLAALLLPALRAYRRGAALLLAGFLLAQAPWLLRNQLMPPGPPEPDLMISFLHHGSYPGFMYHDDPASYGYPYRFDPDNERITRDVPSVLADIAGHFREQPLTYANWYLVGKPGKFLSWGIINGFGDIYTYPPIRSPYLEDLRFALIRYAALLMHWPLMLLGLAGAFVAAWRPRALGLDASGAVVARVLAAVVLYAVGLHMIGAPFPRYAIPFRPFFYLLALAMLLAPWRRRRLAASTAA